MSAVLRNPQECDRVLRMVRPHETEIKNLTKCEDKLKRVLRPAEMHSCGSIGKGTACRAAHDLDVCVKLTRDLRADEALRQIEECIKASQEFQFVRKERDLVKAKFGDFFEIDIICEPLPGYPLSKWSQQLRHLDHFKALDARGKDTVRLLKAWARLRVPVPGILLEAIVCHVSRVAVVGRSSVQALFLAVLVELRTRRQWHDPTNPEKDLGSTLSSTDWESITKYAEETLQLKDNVSMSIGVFCQCSFPCRHDVELLFGPDTTNCIDVPMGSMDAGAIVELSKRLRLRRPTFAGDTQHFGWCPHVKLDRLPAACRNAFLTKAFEMLEREQAKKILERRGHFEDHRAFQLAVDSVVHAIEELLESAHPSDDRSIQADESYVFDRMVALYQITKQEGVEDIEEDIAEDSDENAARAEVENMWWWLAVISVLCLAFFFRSYSHV